MEDNAFKWAFFKRIRHYRGHGVHSPFVYSLVRNVFMKRKTEGNKDIYDELTGAGLKYRYAVELQNLHSYCNKHGLITYGTLDAGMAELKAMSSEARRTGSTFIVLSPIHDPERKRFCSELALSKTCLSIYRKGYIIFFFDDKLPRQHFNL